MIPKSVTLACHFFLPSLQVVCPVLTDPQFITWHGYATPQLSSQQQLCWRLTAISERGVVVLQECQHHSFRGKCSTDTHIIPKDTLCGLHCRLCSAVRLGIMCGRLTNLYTPSSEEVPHVVTGQTGAAVDSYLLWHPVLTEVSVQYRH